MVEIHKTNCTTSASYKLPTVERKIKAPPNCTTMFINLLGGSSSASFDGKSVIGGACGGSVIAMFNAPSVNDNIVIKLGLGGPFKISDNNDIVNANPGQDSILSVNGEIVAIARGASGPQGGDTTTFENKYCTFKTSRGQDGTVGKRGMTSYGDVQLLPHDDLFELSDYDGNKGNGGLGVEFYNDAKYLGAGSHGYAMNWADHFYFYCFKCNTQFYTIESFEEHGCRSIN